MLPRAPEGGAEEFAAVRGFFDANFGDGYESFSDIENAVSPVLLVKKILRRKINRKKVFKKKTKPIHIETMEKLLKLMLDGEALSTEQMGEILGLTKDQLDAEFKKLSDAGILLGWRPVINPDVEESMVHAAIELRINPERDGGFDRLAQRISRFDQVDSCYLMSGAYDLLLFVRRKNRCAGLRASSTKNWRQSAG